MSRLPTAKELRDYKYKVAADFVFQLEDVLDKHGITHADLAERLWMTEKRVSYLLDNPVYLTLSMMIRMARVVDLHLSILSYPHDNKNPINPTIFLSTWKAAGEPRTMSGASEQGSHCLECGPDVRVDEDGCCVTCGRDSMWYTDMPCRCEDFEDGPCPNCLHGVACGLTWRKT